MKKRSQRCKHCAL